MSADQKVILGIFVIYLALNAIIGIVFYSANGREVNSMYPLRKSFLLAGEI